MSDDNAPRIYACLDVVGSFDPHDLTLLLGAEAKIERAGEIRRNGTARDHDAWHYSTEKMESFDWPEHLGQVLALVRPHREDFLALCRDHSLDRAIHLVAEMGSSTPDGSFSAAQLADVAALGCSLEIDLYV